MMTSHADEHLPIREKPRIGVVVPTRNRPELLRRTLRSVHEQNYEGVIETIVVHDGTPLDHSVAVDISHRPVRVVANSRTQGLAGARNTGILALDTAFVAFCDDDDYWLPTKISRQVARARQSDTPELVTCAITVDFDGQRTDRLAGMSAVSHQHLLRSRMSMLHSSTLLFCRESLVNGIGLINETIPGSQNEDWDILLRAAARSDIAHIDEPMTIVQWGRSSMFARQWDTKVRSLSWMLDQHPALRADRKGSSRVYGQLAFGEAARGDRRSAVNWAARSLAAHPLQWRAGAALLVASRAVTADRTLNFLHRFGRGV